MAHNTFVLLQLLEYDRQESGMNIYNALKIKAQSVPDGHSHQVFRISKQPKITRNIQA